MDKLRVTFIVVLLLSFFLGNAQPNFTLYNMNNVIQSNYYNISSMPQNKMNLGLPALSSDYLNVSNSSFKYNDLIYKRADDSLVFDMKNALSKMREQNVIIANGNVDLLSFGFKIKKNYFGINATEKFVLQVNYRKDLLDFLWNGNGPSIGKKLQFNTNFDYTHYREYGLNYVREITDKITAGLRLNFLQGFENFSTDRANVSILTESQFYNLDAKSDIAINQSGKYKEIFDNFKFFKYFVGAKNKGFSIDLGGHYKLNDKFEFSASFNDFGFIKWVNDPNNYTSVDTNSTYTFKGVYIGNLINDTTSINSAFNHALDSAYSSFKIDTTFTAYKTKLARQIYIGGTYNISELFKANLLLYGRFYERKMLPGLSVSLSGKLGPSVNMSISYSMFNRNYSNLGFGFSVNTNNGTQFYVITDNVMGVIFPQKTSQLSLRIGMNIRVGSVGELDDSDGDGIPDIDDKCPKMKGSTELKGCPDKDNDRVADFEDQCPDDYGLPRFKGCPDKDGDNIIDKFDKCPDIPGVQRFQGCPDRDEDGIKDVDDECPDQKGLPEFKGCPDTDGDGIKDSEDKCPNDFGTPENLGCPLDKDHDGVFDIDDICPDEPGRKENKGCPDKDSDGDGLLDKDDHCPNTKGLLSNSGCPELLPEEKLILKVAQENVEFEKGKETLLSTSYAPLDNLANLLKSKLEINLKITVYTDNANSETFAMVLTKDRADVLKEYFIAKGIDHLRIETIPFGANNPVADNNTDAGRYKNNRVELEPVFK